MDALLQLNEPFCFYTSRTYPNLYRIPPPTPQRFAVLAGLVCANTFFSSTGAALFISDGPMIMLLHRIAVPGQRSALSCEVTYQTCKPYIGIYGNVSVLGNSQNKSNRLPFTFPIATGIDDMRCQLGAGAGCRGAPYVPIRGPTSAVILCAATTSGTSSSTTTSPGLWNAEPEADPGSFDPGSENPAPRWSHPDKGGGGLSTAA